MASRIDELVDLVKGHKVYIQTHNYPDPDAVASAYGLQFLLGCYDIPADIIYEGSLNKMYGLRMIDYFHISLQNADEKDLKEEDYIIIVDAQKYNKNCTDLVGDEVACIDHHPTVIDCEYHYKDVRLVGACSTLIADYILEAGITPSEDVATALLYGMKMDTADFSRGVTEMDVKMYYELFPYVDHHTIEKLQVNTIAFTDLQAYGAAINNINAYRRAGYACIPFDCPDALIAIISDFILALDLIDFSVVYSIRPGGYKFSVRSEDDKLDAGKITNKALSLLGKGSGGGHAFMAGGFLPIEEVNKLGDNPRKLIEEKFNQIIYPED